MKKIVSLFLVFVMALSLCACRFDKDEIEHELQGTWYESSTVYYVFDNGSLTCGAMILGQKHQIYKGTYEITKDAIVIYSDGAESHSITYQYKKGILTLYSGDQAMSKQ